MSVTARFTAASCILLAGLAASIACQSVVTLFADEFEGDGLDGGAWGYELGDGSGPSVQGWGNREQQVYTQEAASVGGGLLRITAARQWDGTYTSARIKTLAAWAPGSDTTLRIEASIQLPAGGAGVWPAFWMMPRSEAYGPWPKSGEIDVMEAAIDMSTVVSTLHYWTPGSSNAGYLPGLHSGFNTYSVDWTWGGMSFAVNGQVYHTAQKSRWNDAGESAPFDQPFYIILNLAVGGAWPGDPSGTAFPQSMLVDWVRVTEIRA